MSLPRPYYQDSAVTLYHADCREVLPLLDKASVDLVLTDPPYGMKYESNWEGSLPRSVTGDGDTSLRDLALEWWGSGPALVFGTWRVERPRNTRAVLIYDKGGATGMGDLSIPWKPSHEEIYVLGGPWAGTRDCGSVLQGRVQASAWRGRLHPTEKDYRTLIGLIEKADAHRILDPFAGSGTTLVAAKRLGRKAIGIEIEERYCEIAVRRLAQEQLL